MGSNQIWGEKKISFKEELVDNSSERQNIASLGREKKVKWNKNALAEGHYVALFPSNGSAAVILNAHKMHPWPGHKENRETKRLLIQLQMLEIKLSAIHPNENLH